MVLTGAPQQSIAKSAKQQAFLDSFNQIFESTVAEVENLASYVPREDVLDLAYENPEVLVKLRDADPWTTHLINGNYFLKTGVNTIEPVRDYIFKLEKVVINSQQKVSQAETRYNEMLQIKDEAIDLYRKELDNVRNLGFWSLIKLAFSGLFKGENNGLKTDRDWETFC